VCLLLLCLSYGDHRGGPLSILIVVVVSSHLSACHISHVLPRVSIALGLWAQRCNWVISLFMLHVLHVAPGICIREWWVLRVHVCTCPPYFQHVCLVASHVSWVCVKCKALMPKVAKTKTTYKGYDRDWRIGWRRFACAICWEAITSRSLLMQASLEIIGIDLVM